MDPRDQRILKLARLARQDSGDTPSPELPPGMATRVLAQLHSGGGPSALPWERVSWRAVPLGAAAAIAACVYAWPSVGQAPDERALAEIIVAQQLDR